MSSTTRRAWLRSMLFVPAHKTDWILKAPQYGPSALILDLEDSVPGAMKAQARKSILAALEQLPSDRPQLFVRVNCWGTGMLLDDLLRIAVEGINGIVLPKTSDPQDVEALDKILTDVERRDGLPDGYFEILPLLETARSVERAFEILSSSTRISRITAIAGLTPGMPGDLHRSLGIGATDENDEMSYPSAQMLVAARAAGIEHILGGMVVRIHDRELLERSIDHAKLMGARGSMSIHPSHVPVINEMFAPSQTEINNAVALLEALAAAYQRGDAAVMFDGGMIDRAHARVANILLAEARDCGLTVPPVPSYDEWND